MDEIALWHAGQQRVIGLVREAADPDGPVPACPAWTVRDLLSHMIGLDADVLDGDEPDDHNANWTQRQVDRRAARSADELIAEWEELAPRLMHWMRDNGTRPLGDVTIHEQDLRGALHRPGARSTPAMTLMRDRRLTAFTDATASLPPLGFEGDDGWTVEVDASTLLRAGTFDLTRALMSRRSASQLRAYTVRGDVTPYLDAFAALGPLPEHDLSDD